MEKDNMDKSMNDRKPMTDEVRDVESDAIYEGIKHVDGRMDELMLQHHMGLEDRQIVHRASVSVRYAYFGVDVRKNEEHWTGMIEAARYFMDRAKDRFREWPSVMSQLHDLETLTDQLEEHRRIWYSGGVDE